MAILLIAATAAVCALSADPLCGWSSPNLVTNGDFGTLDLSGWTLDCPEGACTVEPDSSGVSGQFRRTLVENPYTTLSQTLHLNPGRYALAYSIRDSTVLHSPRVPNEITVRLGPVADLYTFGQAELHRYREFVSNGGSTELSFEWFTLYFNSHTTQSMVLDDISVVQLDDGGAAQSANAALAAARSGALGFVETIFSAQGFGQNQLAARPVATAVAGPATVLPGKTRAWTSGGYSSAAWDDANAKSHESTISGGVEADAGDGWAAGFAAAIAGTDASLSGPVSSVESQGQSASFAIYASWQPQDGAYYGRAAAGGGFSVRDHHRTLIFGADPAVASDIDGSHWFASAEGGYMFQPAASISMTPYARLTGVEAREEAYVEIDTGGWIGVTAVAPSTRGSLSSQIGLRGGLTGLLGPEYALDLHAAWRHEFMGVPNSDLTYISPGGGSSFAFRVPGLRESRDSAVFGGALDAALWDQTSLFVRYDGEASDGFTLHSGQMGLRAAW